MVATVLMYLFKEYDCIPYDPELAKLNACGISSMGLLLISEYLSRRKQRLKVDPIRRAS